MQKFDFIQALNEIKRELCVEELYEFFTEAPANGRKQYSTILSTLLDVNTNYQNIVNRDDIISKVLSKLTAVNDVFEREKFVSLIKNVSTVQDVNSMKNNIARPFILAYKFILDLYDVTKDLLLNDITTNEESELTNGVIVLRVNIEESLNAEQYAAIFKAINELLAPICKLYSVEEKPSIILLDSGSDTNIGVKTTVNVANAVFNLFRELLDYIVNFRFAKNDRSMQTLSESLSIRKEIVEAQKNGIISEDEAKEYIHMVKTRTDKLIGLGVVPRKAINDIKPSCNTEWLSYHNLYMLTQKSKENKTEE